MTRPSETPDRDEILDAFTLALENDPTALGRYLGRYPQHADAFVDLSRELARTVVDDERPPTPEEVALAASFWADMRETVEVSSVDPFADRTPAQMREVARVLDLPRQVVTAFRERRVILGTVPRRFIERLAAALETAADVLVAALVAPSAAAIGRSYKADGQPTAVEQVAFERILLDADVDPARIADLIAGRD